MGRRIRAERRYTPPLVKPRSTWSEDELKAETLALARLGVEVQDAPAPVQPESAPEQPAQPAPEPPKPPRKRKVKPPAPPCGFTIAFSPDGEAIGWKVDGKDEIEPLSTRRRTTTKYTKARTQ